MRLIDADMVMAEILQIPNLNSSAIEILKIIGRAPTIDMIGKNGCMKDMEKINLTSKQEFGVFIPQECDLNKCDKIKVRGREFLPIVRCKNCMWFNEVTIDKVPIGYGYCDKVNIEQRLEADWFCADGKQRE